MYDRALIDRTLLAIAVASGASPTPPVLAWLKAWLRRRLAPDAVAQGGEQASG